MARKSDYFKRILSSKLFLAFSIFILIVLAVSFTKETYQKYQLSKEIDDLEAEIERLEGKNQQLGSLMEYLRQESTLEKEARLKLNLKKPGESVVYFSESDSSGPGENEATDTSMEISLGNQEKSDANYWKWWEYFFSPKN